MWSGGGAPRRGGGGVCVKCGCFPSVLCPFSCPMPHAAAVQRRRACGLAAELTRVRAGFSACPPNPGRWQSREPIFSGPRSFPSALSHSRKPNDGAIWSRFPFPLLHGSGHATKLARTHAAGRPSQPREQKNKRGGPFARRVTAQRPSRKLRVGQCHALKPFGGFPHLSSDGPPPLLPARYRTDLVLGRGPASFSTLDRRRIGWSSVSGEGEGERRGEGGRFLLEGRGRTAGRVQCTVPCTCERSRRASVPSVVKAPCQRDGCRCVACWRRRLLKSQDISGHLGDGPDLADSRVNITVVELPLESLANRSPWRLHHGEAEAFPLRSHCLHSRWFGSVDACSAASSKVWSVCLRRPNLAPAALERLSLRVVENNGDPGIQEITRLFMRGRRACNGIVGEAVAIPDAKWRKRGACCGHFPGIQGITARLMRKQISPAIPPSCCHLVKTHEPRFFIYN